MQSIFALDLNNRSFDDLSTLFRAATHRLNRTAARSPERAAALHSLDQISDAMCQRLIA